MKLSLRHVLIAAIAIALLGYIGIVGLAAANEARMVFPGSLIRGSDYWLPHEESGLVWDSVRVTADDGVPVVLVENRIADVPVLDAPWALFFHGNGTLVGGPGSVARFDLLRDAGFHVLAIEFRGYGISGEFGPPSEHGTYADARAGLKYLTDTLDVDPASIVAYGWSIGSGPATYLASENSLGGLVTEGAFTTVPDVAAGIFPWLPTRHVMRTRFDNLTRAQSLDLPWLIFHGRGDNAIPFDHGEALNRAAPHSRFVPLDAGHADGVTTDREVALAELRRLRTEVTGR